MGLDIYLYKVNPAGEDTHEIEEKEKADFLRFFDGKFVEVENEYIDWAKSFAKKGLNEEDYQWFMTDSTGYYFTSKHTFNVGADVMKTPVIFKDDELLTFMQKDNALPIEEIGYQRKGISGFGKEFPGRCEDGTLTLFTKEEVTRLLPYVHDYYKAHFKSSFIDRFINGEMFLWLWW